MATAAVRLLVVCTANQCRSPMAEVIARDLAARRGIEVAVRSAGTGAIDGVPATDGACMTVRKLGLDLTDHLSRSVTAELVASADLVIAMEQQHVIDLVTDHGASLATTYTLQELAGRAETATRYPDEPMQLWFDRLAIGRTASSVLSAQEIDDPTGRSMRRYRATARTITTCLERFVDASIPNGGT